MTISDQDKTSRIKEEIRKSRRTSFLFTLAGVAVSLASIFWVFSQSYSVMRQADVAAQNLAKLQQQGGVQDFRDLFAPTKSQDDFIHKLDITKFPAIDTQLDDVDTIGYDATDSVQVNAPNKDAAVAEAKPVGK